MRLSDVKLILNSKVYKRNIVGEAVIPQNDRHEIIIELAGEKAVGVEFLANRLKVTLATIRNDINKLIKLKKLVDISANPRVKLVVAL